jgi:hypothetical protein
MQNAGCRRKTQTQAEEKTMQLACCRRKQPSPRRDLAQKRELLSPPRPDGKSVAQQVVGVVGVVVEDFVDNNGPFSGQRRW